MNIVRSYLRVARRLVWLSFVAALANCTADARTEEKYEVLRTRTASYTNVTVTTKDRSYIFILHNAGMNSIRIADLPVDVQQELGYAVAPTNAAPEQRFKGMNVFARGLNQLEEKLKPYQATWGAQLQEQLKNSEIEITPEMKYGAIAGAVVLYLFFCLCCHLICLKAKSPAGILAWIPPFQIFALLRAANMSGWWFIALLIPFLNILAHILWSLNITKARGKGGLAALFLILPVTNLLAFLYLAFASGPPEPPAPRYKSMSLATT